MYFCFLRVSTLRIVGRNAHFRFAVQYADHPKTMVFAVKMQGKDIACIFAVKMQWKGRPSVSGPNNFHLRANSVQGGEAGLFLFSLVPSSTPFFGGTLCLGGNIMRTPVSLTGGTKGLCDGVLDFHMSQSYMAARGLTPGTIVYAQGWFRDTLQMDGTGVGLTDAISFTICP